MPTKDKDIPLISVIVPCYCVQQFIEKGIESIKEQTYRNIELILIDDGSFDGCGTIIDRYIESDDRVIVIHKKNEGVSAARNNGILISNGEYILFVDGDDYVDSTYIEYFSNLIMTSRCEMAVSTEYYYTEELPQKKINCCVLDSTEVVEKIYLGNIGVAVWNKIYSKKIIDKWNIKFNESVWFAEGMLFNILYLQRIEKVAVGNQRVYHAVNNKESATRKFNLNSWICGLQSMEFQRNHWPKESKRIQMAWEYHYRRYAEAILYGLIQTNEAEKYKEITNHCINILRSNLNIPLQVSVDYWIKSNAICLAVNPVLSIKGIRRFRECKSLKEKIDLFHIKIIDLTPNRLKAWIFKYLELYLKGKYKPFYLNRSLLCEEIDWNARHDLSSTFTPNNK